MHNNKSIDSNIVVCILFSTYFIACFAALKFYFTDSYL